jgi:PAS domain-containing protein
MSDVRQRPVALILARELAVNLTTPMWIWDGQGSLVYFNEPAAVIVGRPYDDVGSIKIEELGQFKAEDLDGSQVDPSDLPSAVAFRERRPDHRLLNITGLDGVKRRISVTATPLFVRGDEFVGAMAVFWQLPEGP